MTWVMWRRRRAAAEAPDPTVEARLQDQARALETSRSQMEDLLHGMVEGVLAIGPRGEILVINPAAREILGIPPGRTPAAAADVVRQPELKALLDTTLATGGPAAGDVTLYAPAERRLRVHATSCQAPDGRGALLVLHDITDLQRLEQIRREFVANVSHELKTPLTAIRGAVETLLDGALGDPRHNRSFVEAIAEESARLGRLVDDLLTLAQVESKPIDRSKRPIAVGEFLTRELARQQALAATCGVTLTAEAVEPALTVSADPHQLTQAVGNLLENAIKYNRPQGRVMVRAAADGPACRIVVEDTGMGIPAADLPRIFERFYRVDKARSRETGGTGLGLSIIKHVAEAHGGSVSVESRPGHGSCFTLRLPLA
ncbi:MAG: GHKL domain-containing protein [Candidatus Omnitrophica bacterium]|nr:GHKL domain-containing protein [Candidatus Omnitrophota bacterium]